MWVDDSFILGLVWALHPAPVSVLASSLMLPKRGSDLVSLSSPIWKTPLHRALHRTSSEAVDLSCASERCWSMAWPLLIPGPDGCGQ